MTVDSWSFRLSLTRRISLVYHTTNISMALIHMDRRAHELQMRVVLGSSSDPAPGRTLNQIYSHVGDYVGMQVSRVAHRSGRGPTATSYRIEAFFGTGHQREAKLDALEGCPQLEEECSKLLKYALPCVTLISIMGVVGLENRRCKTARTQVATFKCIVTIATRYHGTRRLFLKSKHLRCAGDTEALISAVWARADDTHPHEWDYYCQFAAACLSENPISLILEDALPQFLGSIDTESGDLSVIERLLIASESRFVIFQNHCCRVQFHTQCELDPRCSCAAIFGRSAGTALLLARKWGNTHHCIHQNLGSRNSCSE